MESQDYIKRIIEASIKFVEEAKANQQTGLTDYNLMAESTLIPILNVFFDLQLQNANAAGKKNYPAVDLIDRKNRVAFQITATPGLDKIRATLEKFRDHNLAREYDTLYVYILTEKQKTYSDVALQQAIPHGFHFETGDHVLDMSDLRGKLLYLPIEKLELLTRIFEHQFSSAQMESREKEYKQGYLKYEPEKLYLNFLQVSFPRRLYIADISLDEEAIKERINDWRAGADKKPRTSFSKQELLASELRNQEIWTSDFIVRENQIITFRELQSNAEPLSRFVDKGTTTWLLPEEYYLQSEAHQNNFRDLLKRMLTALCKGREMEWVDLEEVLRFRNFRKDPQERKLRWVGKKQAVKTVIFKILHKKEGYLICFRHLAFRPSFQFVGDTWYLVCNPTWSFTNPSGKYPSRWGSKYMAGIKRLERNNSVCNYYRFFGYYLSHPNLFSDHYPYLTVHEAKPFDFAPSIVESKWLPPKQAVMPDDMDAVLEEDRELTKKELG